MAAAKKRGLGRGLDALLGGDGEGTPSVLAQEGELRTLPIQQIQPGKYQPRRHWNDEALDELAASIKAQGLIQPVVVREIGKHRYELIAGERRWRAAQRAQLGEIPALIKQVAEQAAKVGAEVGREAAKVGAEVGQKAATTIRERKGLTGARAPRSGAAWRRTRRRPERAPRRRSPATACR